jgi:hypothetical protein
MCSPLEVPSCVALQHLQQHCLLVPGPLLTGQTTLPVLLLLLLLPSLLLQMAPFLLRHHPGLHHAHHQTGSRQQGQRQLQLLLWSGQCCLLVLL